MATIQSDFGQMVTISTMAQISLLLDSGQISLRDSSRLESDLIWELGFDPREAQATAPGAVLTLEDAIAAAPTPASADNIVEGMSTNGGVPVAVAGVQLGGAGSFAAMSTEMEAGADLRDIAAGPVGALPVLLPIGGLIARMAGTVAARSTTFVRGTFASGARITWSSLPGWLQTAIVAVGGAVGIDLLMDLPGNDFLPEIFGGGVGQHPIEGIAGHPGAHIIGQWVANGVTFYRLADGRLAVQNKKGRWKVWRPKKPIVLMPTGAGDLRTLLRADAVLNKQSKKIAAMLNRRVGTRKPRSKSVPSTVVVAQDGAKVTQI